MPQRLQISSNGEAVLYSVL